MHASSGGSFGRPRARPATPPCRPPARAPARAVSAASSAHGEPREHAVRRGRDDQSARPRAARAGASSRVRTPQTAPGICPARNSTLRARSITTAPVAAAASVRRDGRRTAASELGHRDDAGSGDRHLVEPTLDNEHVAVAHLPKPGAGHPCADAVVVDQRDPRAAYADPADRSPARAARPARSGCPGGARRRYSAGSRTSST